MTDARAFLESRAWSCTADPAVFPGCGICAPCRAALAAGWRAQQMRDALLAVLDVCDRLDHDAEQMLHRFGPGDYYMGQRMGLMTSVSDVRRAINEALGVSGE